MKNSLYLTLAKCANRTKPKPKTKKKGDNKIILCNTSAQNRLFVMALLTILRYIVRTKKDQGFQKCFYSIPRLEQDLVPAQTVETSTQNSLSQVSEDLSSLSPYYPETFNLAAYVNKSELLQNFIHLNVNLSKIEKKPYIVEKILKLDFEKVKNHIIFLKDFIHGDDLGEYFTKNPMILNESLEDLQVRVNYLQAKHFSDSQIHRVISKNPYWLMFSTSRIDKRLGYFQLKFSLSGAELRLLTAKQPKLITYNLNHINVNTFAIKEEMGFEDQEIKKLILYKPKLWMTNQLSLLTRFNYIHNTMNISHSMILLYPETLLCRNFRLKQRHLFLKNLGRDQFDPTKENYVPIKALVENTDSEFCKKYAKCNVHDFNIFLKTL